MRLAIAVLTLTLTGCTAGDQADADPAAGTWSYVAENAVDGEPWTGTLDFSRSGDGSLSGTYRLTLTRGGESLTQEGDLQNVDHVDGELRFTVPWLGFDFPHRAQVEGADLEGVASVEFMGDVQEFPFSATRQ